MLWLAAVLRPSDAATVYLAVLRAGSPVELQEDLDVVLSRPPEDLLQVAKDLGATKPMFCFCGPLPFSAPLMAALEEAGIPAADIKSESFG